jgi:hypothetical protein
VTEIDVQASGFDTLIADLAEAPIKAGRNIRSAVEFTAHGIRDDWRTLATGFVHLPAFPASITYDLSGIQAFGGTTLQAEIGPDKDRAQGALGNLVEYGSVNNAPLGLGAAALAKNEADFEAGLSKAVGAAF